MEDSYPQKRPLVVGKDEAHLRHVILDNGKWCMDFRALSPKEFEKCFEQVKLAVEKKNLLCQVF